MTFDITAVINTGIALIAAAISAVLIPWLKTKTTEGQRQQLVAWTKIGVAAAEQLFKGDKRGEEKKQYVLNFLQEKGFTIDLDSINAAIEAAVRQLNSEGITIS